MNNFWGPPDEDEYEGMPQWMIPPAKRRNQPRPHFKSSKSLTEAIEEALKKPAVPVNINEPDIK